VTSPDPRHPYTCDSCSGEWPTKDAYDAHFEYIGGYVAGHPYRNPAPVTSADPRPLTPDAPKTERDRIRNLIDQFAAGLHTADEMPGLILATLDAERAAPAPDAERLREIVRALTVRQPWATLLASGVKVYETRSWRAPEALTGQRILIHASASLSASEREFARSLRRQGILPVRADDLPTGRIVGSARLVACVPTGRGFAPGMPERLLGDFSPGRWAWLMADPEELDVPVAAKGRLGLWKYGRG
jgi:hypothetical protein